MIFSIETDMGHRGKKCVSGSKKAAIKILKSGLASCYVTGKFSVASLSPRRENDPDPGILFRMCV